MADFDIKELQKIELEILLEVDRICKKHNIRYFLVSGTLLGAIRHKGFIPWDDDIDISMPIEDYYKFCKICKKELSNVYFLQNFKTDTTGMWFSKIRKNNTTAIETNHETKLHHQGIWIDIFPLIGVKNNKTWIDKLNKKAALAKKILNKKIGLMEDTENKLLYKAVNKLLPLKLCKLVAGILFKSCFKSTNKYTHCYYLWASPRITARFKTDLFDEITTVEFEGYMLPVPKKWDEYLTVVYGDYMTPPPPEKRNGGCHTLSIIDINNNYTKYTK
ncbi:MAG: LicD family protein [Clostridia bacterium]|nr:LicD family protein [Clostridia bacterium]